MERIQKLLALTTSPNINEASNAAAKVQEILDVHNLSMSQVTAHEASSGVRSKLPITSSHHAYGPRHSPMNQAWQWLMNVLGTQHHCQTFAGAGRDRRTGKTESLFVVVGGPTNVQATVTLFEWLKTQLDIEATKQWPAYTERLRSRNRHPSGSPVAFRINFVYGAAVEIARIMKRRRRNSGRETAVTALAADYRDAIDEYVENNLTVREGKTGATLNADILAQRLGREAGARLERMSRSLGDVDEAGAKLLAAT